MEYFSKILHIDLREGAHSVIDRFLSITDHDIIFTIPTGALILQNPTELKLLKQAVDQSGKNIVLVSQDQDGIELARDIGFKVEEEFLELLSPSEEEHKYSAETHKHPKVLDIIYNKSQPTKQIILEEEKEETAEIVSSASQKEHIKEFIPEKPILKESLPIRKPKSKIFTITNFIIVFIIISIGVAALSMTIVLPEASIVIIPKKETLVLDLPIKADTSISTLNLIQNKIPGQIVKIEKEKISEFKATGKSTGESKARGKIVIFNAQTPPQSQSLVQATRFETSDGKIFRITKNIIVPAAKINGNKVIPGSIEANVIADTAGPSYNIEPSEFTIPGFKGSSKFTAFYGKSTLPMSGGSLKGGGSAVTLDDIDNAKKQIENEVIEAAKNELKEKLPKDLVSIDDAIATKIIEETISAQPGTATENFSIKLRVAAMTFLLQEEDIKSLIAKNIETKIPNNKIVYKNMQKKYDKIDADFTAGVLSFNAHVEQEVQPAFDIPELKKSFAGKNESEIRDYVMSQESIDSARISFSPIFVKKAPSNTDRIKITIGE